MVKRHNHYEAAFEDYLRAERIPYIAVNEQRRALATEGSLKNVDFILSPDVSLPPLSEETDYGTFESQPAFEHRSTNEDGPSSNPSLCSSPSPSFASQQNMRWLIDIKGRQFPSGSQYWRNWTTADELDSLARWRFRFGKEFDAALVFTYQLMADRSPVPAEQIHYFRDKAYAFVAVRLDDYRSAAKTLSPSWGTVSVRAAQFREQAQPLVQLLGDRPMHSNGSIPARKPPVTVMSPRINGFESYG